MVPGALEAVARACSPRVERHGNAGIAFDARGLARVIGPPAEIAREVSRVAAEHGIVVRVALAGTTTTAWLLAHARSGVTIVAPGEDAAVLAPLPLGWLGALTEQAEGQRPEGEEKAQGERLKAIGRRPQAEVGSGTEQQAIGTRDSSRRTARARNYRIAPGPELSPTPEVGNSSLRPLAFGLRPDLEDALAIFERWGLRTLGDLARLRRADLHARLGPLGVRLHQAAMGEDASPLVPLEEPRPFVSRLELEWPIDGLEPLSFVLARQCDSLGSVLERADRGAVAVTTRLRLVTRTEHVRTLHLPSPIRDPRTLRTLVLLDLESHPPPAAIDVVTLELDVVPGLIVQGTLLTRTLPSPDDLATLTSRLCALMGDTRVGAPALVETHDERQSTMATFLEQGGRPKANGRRPKPVDGATQAQGTAFVPCLRRYRLPLAVTVEVERGRPATVRSTARGIPGGDVVNIAGPWRTSGGWWAPDEQNWDRDEWDVELVSGGCYRLVRDRVTGRWEIEGEMD
jgi:protein ImuB